MHASVSNVLYGSSVVLLFQYSTSVIHSRVTITGRVDYGSAVIEPHGDLIHSQGVCFYAAMDIIYSTVMPLSTNLVINNWGEPEQAPQ